MVSLPQNCELPCSCKEKHSTPQLVVLTGGPGAGKTAVLEFVRKALCDRGTLDGLAYWPETDSEFFAALNTNLEMEFKKYKAVVHLRSPSFEKGYNYQNPIRVESAELAAKIDQRIHEIWKDHSNYFLIESTADFTTKLQIATKYIQSLMPACCKDHLIGTLT